MAGEGEKKSSFRLEERIITTDESVCVCIFWVNKNEDEINSKHKGRNSEWSKWKKNKLIKRKKKTNQNLCSQMNSQ